MNRFSRCELVGRYYNQGPRVVNGTVLQFQRDPTNSHDPCAIRVTLVDQPDQLIGYLPRNVAQRLAPYIDSNMYAVEHVVARRRPGSTSIQLVFLVLEMPGAYA